jgi:hypothetical protein
MAEQGETASVRLQEIAAVKSTAYLDAEWDLIAPDSDHLIAVIFRVNMGRDAFPLPVLMDRRETAEDLLVQEARKRAEAMLRAATLAIADHSG